MESIKFTVEELNEHEEFINGEYIVYNDSSMLFSSPRGGFQLILGGYWNYSLDIDCETGRCYSFSTFLDALKMGIYPATIIIPKNHKAKLCILNSHDILGKSSADYHPFINRCAWDKKNKILALGDYENQNGVTIEFSTGTFATVENNRIISVYIKLNFDLF